MKRQRVLKIHTSSRISVNILSEIHQNAVKLFYTGAIPGVCGDDIELLGLRFFVHHAS
jgi:hypothetical protein